MNRHLTNHELLNRLYGLGEAEGELDLHLGDCSECAERWRVFERRRAETAAEPGVSTEFLAAQRRAIYARLEDRPGLHVRWAPALAAGFLLAAGAYLAIPARHTVPQTANPAHNRPAPVARVVRAEMSDEQLFSTVYSMEQSAEPRAAVPLHALFSAAAGDEEQ